MYQTLRSELAAAGISEQEAARVIGRSEETLSKAFNGERDFKLFELMNLKKALQDRGRVLKVEELHGG